MVSTVMGTLVSEIIATVHHRDTLANAEHKIGLYREPQLTTVMITMDMIALVRELMARITGAKKGTICTTQ